MLHDFDITWLKYHVLIYRRVLSNSKLFRFACRLPFGRVHHVRLIVEVGEQTEQHAVLDDARPCQISGVPAPADSTLAKIIYQVDELYLFRMTGS